MTNTMINTGHAKIKSKITQVTHTQIISPNNLFSFSSVAGVFNQSFNQINGVTQHEHNPTQQ